MKMLMKMMQMSRVMNLKTIRKIQKIKSSQNLQSNHQSFNLKSRDHLKLITVIQDSKYKRNHDQFLYFQY